MATNEHSYDLAVAWRIYPGVSKTPIIHSDNKLKLVETSLRSFLACVKDLKVAYYFLLDGCPEDYVILINKLFENRQFKIQTFDTIGNAATFGKQIEILLHQKHSELVYFAEDDYLYRPDSFRTALNMMKRGDVDFVTCYTHPDVFFHPIHTHKRNTKLVEDDLWMTVNSTCLTFLTSKAILTATKNVFYKYVYSNIYDCSMWLILTKEHLFSWQSWRRYRTDPMCKAILKKGMKKGIISYFKLRKYKLWMPLMAIGTHLEFGLESPFVDWQKIVKGIEAREQ